MMRALRAIDRYWVPEVPPQRLAMLRILVGGYAVVYLLVRSGHLLSYAHFAPIQFDPVGVVSLLPRPLIPAAVQGLVLVAIALSPAFLLGWRYRVTAPLFAAAMLWVLTYSNSWGQILHTDNLLMMHVIVLALAPAADTMSLDARRRADAKAPEPSGRYGWAIRLMCAICVVAYVLAGVAKIRNGGTAFIEGDTLRNFIAFDNVRKIALGSIHSPVATWVLPYEGFFAGLAWLTMALELGAPVAMLHRRAALWWVVLVWGFHLGVLVLMAIAFVYPLTGIAFAPFFRVEELLPRLRRMRERWRARRVAAPAQ